jgi:hypothetical protein
LVHTVQDSEQWEGCESFSLTFLSFPFHVILAANDPVRAGQNAGANIMRCFLRIVILAVAMGLQSYAHADDVLLAKDLAGFCQSKDLAVHNACKFFILGVFQTASAAQSIQGHKICIPDNLPGSTMEFVVRTTLAEIFEFYPSDRESPAVSMVIAVIVKRFPCASK